MTDTDTDDKPLQALAQKAFFTLVEGDPERRKIANEALQQFMKDPVQNHLKGDFGHFTFAAQLMHYRGHPQGKHITLPLPEDTLTMAEKKQMERLGTTLNGLTAGYPPRASDRTEIKGSLVLVERLASLYDEKARDSREFALPHNPVTRFLKGGSAKYNQSASDVASCYKGTSHRLRKFVIPALKELASAMDITPDMPKSNVSKAV